MPFTCIRRRNAAAEDASAAPVRKRVFTARFFLDLGLFLAVYVLCLLGLAATSPQPYESLVEGQRAPATVLAKVDFTCPDWDATNARKDQASKEVRPVFSVSRDAAGEAIRAVSRLAGRARQLRAGPPVAPPPAPSPRATVRETAGKAVQTVATTVKAAGNAVKATGEAVKRVGRGGNDAGAPGFGDETPEIAGTAADAAIQPPETAGETPESAQMAQADAGEDVEAASDEGTAAKKAKKRKKTAGKGEEEAGTAPKTSEMASKTAEKAEFVAEDAGKGPEDGEKSAGLAQNDEVPPETSQIPDEDGDFWSQDDVFLAENADSGELLPDGSASLPLPMPAGTASREERVAASLADAANMLDVPLSGETLAALFPAGRESEVRSLLTGLLQQATANGLVSPADRDNAFNGLLPAGELALPAPGGGYVLHPLATLATPEEAAQAFARAAAEKLSSLGIPAPESDLLALVSGKLEANLAYDPAATAAARATAVERVPAATRLFRVGETLMEERQRVTRQVIDILSAHARRIAELETPADRRRHLAGRALVLLVSLLLCLAWERSARRDAVPRGISPGRRRWLLPFLALLSFALALACRALCTARTVLPMWLLPYMLPLAAAPILAVLFSDRTTGLVAALWTGLSCELLFGETGGVAIPAFAASAAAALLLGRVHKRSQIMRAGLLSGAAAVLVAAAYAVMQRPSAGAFAAQAAAALAGGFLSGMLATLLLPSCEWMFDFTTGVTLLELTDAGHPLLRRLAVEAPGTYHHSLMVAALASAAAAEIGADELETTVDAYFHDIGKLAKPEFFTENQRGGSNPHDELAPAMSAIIIQSHVKEGLSLAKRNRLPGVVRRAIASHHGTSLASFFYQLAKKEAAAAGLPEAPGLEASFRYDGPLPRTKEHAILMLADGIEAASRSLEKPTPQHIRTLVERMTAARIADGQLDESPLSLGEIAKIRESLVFSLWNMRHGRTPYPSGRADRPAKKA
jgi:hypothetical protein